jgi:glycosyltransferase involved in cell wall biosynthesis
MRDESGLRVVLALDRLQMGGAELNTLALAGALRGLGVDARICVLGDRADPLLARRAREAGIAVHALGVERFLDVAAGPRLVALIDRIAPDVLHLQDPAPAPAACYAGLARRIPLVHTQHVRPGQGERLRDRLREKAAFACLRHTVDDMILVADALRDEVAAASGFRRERMTTVRNGLAPLPDRRPERHAIRSRLGIAPERDVLLMVGVCRPGKGHEQAIEAMPAVLCERPDTMLCIAGDGPLRAELERLARPLGGSVHFLGARGDVADLMAMSDVVLLPSRSEALPTVLLEAAMGGVPSIATRVGGTPEILSHGETGLLVEPGDGPGLAQAILMLLRKPAWRAAMGDAARLKATTEFTLEGQARNTLVVYRRVTERARMRDAGPRDLRVPQCRAEGKPSC